jgi:hypothetical protein
MKYIILIIAFLFSFIFLAQTTFASGNWVINNFQSVISIQENGQVSVTETIAVDFGSEQKHGIFRNIPYSYSNDQQQSITTDINVVSVSQDGNTAHYRSYKQDQFLVIQIGDSNNTISGKHSYKISYLISGVIRSFENYDELYWDVAGNGWPVPIQSISATVTAPLNGIIKTACFQGAYGSKDSCSNNSLTKGTATFTSTNLEINQDLTIVVGLKSGLVPILQPVVSLDTPQSFSPSQAISDIFQGPNIAALIITFILSISSIMYLWWRNGRDLWWQRPQYTITKNDGEIKPVGSYEPVVVEYSSPLNMRPAIMGVLMDETADTLDVTATIIDLAVKGYFKIEELEKTWLFGTTDYKFIRNEKSEDGLLSYEKLLLHKLFNGADSVKMSNLKENFYADLVKVKQALYTECVSQGYFVQSPEFVRNRYLLLGIVVIIISLIGIYFSAANYMATIFGISIGGFLGGIVIFLFAKFMPRRTALGHQMYMRALGYRLFISKVEQYKQQVLERQNIFSEALPYAIIFGQTKKFAKAFEDMGIKPPAPAWFISPHPFSPYYFSNTMNSFTSSISYSIASQPKSNRFVSSGSGFSGGFSGGGFGGGGGGSW